MTTKAQRRRAFIRAHGRAALKALERVGCVLTVNNARNRGAAIIAYGRAALEALDRARPGHGRPL